jgi:hypothetical protein
VPPGLQSLSPALHTLAEFFQIDEMLVQVAAEASGEQLTPPEGWLQSALERLPGEERDAFLLRLARGEPHLAVDLNRRLRQVSPLHEPAAAPRRTVGQLRQKAEARWEEEHRRRVEEAEAKRIRGLEALAARESETWAEVFDLIERMQGKAYDEAVELLGKLRDLAEYQGEEGAFQQRLNGIYEQYSRRSGLLRRLGEAGLHSL